MTSSEGKGRCSSYEDLHVAGDLDTSPVNNENYDARVSKSLQNLKAAAKPSDLEENVEERKAAASNVFGKPPTGSSGARDSRLGSDGHERLSGKGSGGSHEPKIHHVRHGSDGGERSMKTMRDMESGEEEVVICYEDAAVDIEETGAGNVVESDLPLRLLIVSSKIRNSVAMRHALLPNITFVQFKFDSATLDGILELVSSSLGTKKVGSIALIFSCVGASIHICGKEEKVITKDNLQEHESVRDFLFNLTSAHLDSTCATARVDFLACSSAVFAERAAFTKEVEALIGVPVGMSRDITGADISVPRTGEENSKPKIVGELYFRLDKLRGWSGQQQQSLAGFEKIQTVGKGAYGAAVLYKKKDDDSLVILKEINMHDLNASERQLALNEVKILAMLDHPNIISYYDSFEEDGVLMIEMEYADGGTLSQFLAQQEKALEEKEILCMFQQIVAAIRHIHEHNILHRDLKTANIFLTKEGVVKVGDFGISKMMSTANKGANTVLGTPYYISPEMCEGKPYKDKSDTWALGCILYEMACRQKTFEGSNLPALVNKIMKGQFAPVKGNYSQEFKDLIMDMLKQDPDQRPSANEIMYTRLPELLNTFEDPVTDYEDEMLMPSGGTNAKKKTRSVFLYFESSTATITPIELPPKIKIRQAAVGADHVIVVTMERQVFTWGDGSKGQLGHGDTLSKSKPYLVESLKGKSISRACCGDGFSVFASDNGIVLTCGDGANGCLGHGDWSPTYRPRLIEPLLSTDVISVACGPEHVVVVGNDGAVFSWGQGADGRLGLGNEEDQCQPMEVTILDPVVIRSVHCGVDGTMFLTDVKTVYACGSNLDNKLGLNNRQGFIMAMKNIFTKTEVEGQLVPTSVRALTRHRVMEISIGLHHSAVIVEPGHVYTFGRNMEGQLGIGNTKQSSAPVEVKFTEETIITRVQCGEHYSVASTADNELYYWGLRFKAPVIDDAESRSSNNDSVINRDDLRLESITPRKGTGTHSRQPSTTSVNSVSSAKDSINMNSQAGSVVSSGIEGDHENEDPQGSPERQMSVDSTLSANLTDSGLPGTPYGSDPVSRSGFRPLSSVPRRSASASSRENSKEKEKDHDSNKEDSEIIFPPMHLMRIQKSVEALTLSSSFCHGENLFIQLETTAPPPRRRSRKKRGIRKRFSGNTLNVPQDAAGQFSASSREGGDEYSSEASEMDTQGMVPNWLRQELKMSEMDANDGNEADDTSDQSDSDELRRAVVDNSMSSIQINRELTPCKTGEKKPSPRLNKVGQVQPVTVNADSQPTELSSDSRVRSLSTNSTESEVEYRSGEFNSDSSTKEVTSNSTSRLKDQAQVPKKVLPVSTVRKLSAPTPYRSKVAAVPKPRVRTAARGRGDDLALKEQLAARGFVSDVTVKRREEALLNELEMTRGEKKQAEQRIKELEDVHRQHRETLRMEAEQIAVEREQRLLQELDLLKQELRSQTSKLQNNEKIVKSLQLQLNKVQESTSRSRSAGSDKDSKVCSIQ